MVGPAGEKQVDLAEETQHGRDATQRQQAEAQSEGDEWILLIQAGVIRDPVAARSDREQDDAGEGPEIHEQIGSHIENHRGETVLGAADHADHHEAGLTDRAVGQHPFHGGLGQCHHVAQRHAEHRQNGEQQLPLAIKSSKTTHQDPQG